MQKNMIAVSVTSEMKKISICLARIQGKPEMNGLGPRGGYQSGIFNFLRRCLCENFNCGQYMIDKHRISFVKQISDILRRILDQIFRLDICIFSL